MSWIKIISYKESTGKLRQVYDRVKDRNDFVDNILLSHSLRPHTLEGHMSLYKNVLHHTGNTLPAWFLEVIGVYVSLLNHCSYCVDHHLAGMKKLQGADTTRAKLIQEALENDNLPAAFSGKELLLLQYTKKLTQEPASVGKKDIDILQQQGIEDGEILEVNQVASYFAYANRTVLGLGTETADEKLGLSPSNADDEEDWEHR